MTKQSSSGSILVNRTAALLVSASLLGLVISATISLHAQIDPHRETPAISGGNMGPAGCNPVLGGCVSDEPPAGPPDTEPGLSGRAYCDGLFKHVELDALENYSNGQLYERANELMNCVLAYTKTDPKTEAEGSLALGQIQEVNNANLALLARLKKFINQKGLTHEFLFPDQKGK